MAKVVIYSKVVCPYCVRAKTLLKNKNIDFEEIMVDDKPDVYQQLKEKTGMMTVPQIFINDELVGGYTDLADMDRSGELDKLLKS
jgi:glutaredoxin 3